jgi:hypothetical protein
MATYWQPPADTGSCCGGSRWRRSSKRRKMNRR